MTINLRDYGRTSEQRGWGKGWPSCSGAKGDTVVVSSPSGTRVSVRRRLSRLVSLLFAETERRGYAIRKGVTGGHNCRAIGGTRRPSNHSWGLAVDINWDRNPMRRPLTTDMPGWMVQLWGRFGFAWGGHYTSTPDSMHFEFMGTPAQADAMTALAMRELAGRAAPAQRPVAPRPASSGRPVLRRGSKGPAVAELQRVLGAWYPHFGLRVDGDFGPATEQAVRHLQSAARIAVDGIAGGDTYRALRMA